MQVYEEVSPPEEVIREALLISKVREGIPGKHYMLYSQLLEAWDALAYDRYIPDERNERLAGHVLQLAMSSMTERSQPLISRRHKRR